jgi:hypothetical protein
MMEAENERNHSTIMATSLTVLQEFRNRLYSLLGNGKAALFDTPEQMETWSDLMPGTNPSGLTTDGSALAIASLATDSDPHYPQGCHLSKVGRRCWERIVTTTGKA